MKSRSRLPLGRAFALCLALLAAVPAVGAPCDDPFTELAASPNGRAVALAARGDLWFWPGNGKPALRLTSGGASGPHFDTGGRWVYFSARRDGNTDLYRVSIDGRRQERLTRAPASEVGPAPSPDGRSLAYSRFHDINYTIFLLRDATPERLSSWPGLSRRPRWSPDGMMLAFERVRLERIYTVLYDLAARRERALPTADLAQPSFRADGTLWALHAGGVWRIDTQTGQPLTQVAENAGAYAWADASTLYFLREGRLFRSREGREEPLSPRLEADLGVEFRQMCEAIEEEFFTDAERRRAWQGHVAQHSRSILAATSTSDYDRRVAEFLFERPASRAPARAERHMVVSAHPLASESGLRILRRGGNVVDAAVAAAMTAGVVEPDGSGVGGEGLLTLYLKGMKSPVVLDFRSAAPLRAHPDEPALRRADNSWVQYGPAAAATPGLVDGLYRAWERYGSGRIAWSELCADAIRYASEGAPLSRRQAAQIAARRERLAADPGLARVFLDEAGRPLKAGVLLRQTELAWTLTQISERGRDGFYSGEVAERLDAYMRARGGLLRKDDLDLYRSIERTPVSVSCRGLTAYGSGPPSAGSITLLRSLAELDARPRLTRPYASDPAAFDTLARSLLAGYGLLSLVADPRFWDQPVDDWLTVERDPGHTTHLTVMDAEGNAIAITQTLGYFFGAMAMVEGTGILLNNEIKNYRTAIGQPDCLLPLARSGTTTCPTLLFRPAGDGPGEVVLAIGAAGGPAIPSSVFLTLAGILEYGKSPQEAVEMPRFGVNRGRWRRFALENNFAPAVEAHIREELGRSLYFVSARGMLEEAFCNLIARDPETGVLEGGVDPRRDGLAIGE